MRRFVSMVSAAMVDDRIDHGRRALGRCRLVLDLVEQAERPSR